MAEQLEVDDEAFVAKSGAEEDGSSGKDTNYRQTFSSSEIEESNPLLSTNTLYSRLRSTDRSQGISVRLETTLRMTLAAFLAYTLSYADLPHIIPPSQKWLIGLFGSIIPLRVPTYIFALGSVGPAIYLLLFFGLASVTMVLAAATVSDGFYVFVNAVWSFWIACLRYGSFGKMTYIFPGVLVTIVGLLGVGLQKAVSEGIVITIDPGILGALAEEIKKRLSMSIVAGASSQPLDLDPNIVRQVLVDLLPPELQSYLQALSTSIREYMRYRIPDILSELPPLVFTVPSGLLKGRTVTMDILGVGSDGNHDLQIKISAGGTWLIKQLWKQQGTENPAAVFRNFLIVFSWALLCVSASQLITPWRTLRHDISKLVVPKVLKKAATLMRSSMQKREKTDKMKEAEIETPASDEDHNQQDQLVQIRNGLLKTLGVVHGGTVAAATVFEPRILEFQPRTATWPKLKALIASVERAAVEFIMFDNLAAENISEEPPSNQIQASIEVLEKCSQAMANVEPIHLTSSDNGSGDEPRDQAGSYTDELLHTSKNVAEKSNEWVESMYPTRKESLSNKNLLLNVVPWCVSGIAIGARLLEFFFIPFHILRGKGRVDWGKLAHYVKFSAGFTGLLCMSLYWDEYRDYDVTPDEVSDSDLGKYVTVNAAGPGSFAGWTLIAFAFTAMPTAEGTLKKGVLRLLGTLLGAFSAWFSLKFWSENKAGMVAWLTGTTFLATWFAVDDEPLAARMGTSKDFGYGGFYIVLTQSVIVMEALGGVDDRDDLVVNRIISNVTGIAVAMFFALIPPTVFGGDPYRSRFMLDSIRSGTKDYIQLLLDGTSDPTIYQELEILVTKNTDRERTDCLFLLEDAKRLSFFPLYKTDPLLENALVEMTTTESILSALIASTARSVKTREDSVNDVDSIRDALSASLDALMKGESAVKDDQVAQKELMSTLILIINRLADHAQTLNQVKFGIFPRQS